MVIELQVQQEACGQNCGNSGESVTLTKWSGHDTLKISIEVKISLSGVYDYKCVFCTVKQIGYQLGFLDKYMS